MPRDAEHQQQVALFQWLRLHESRFPELRRVFAVPNGGHRGKASAGKAKAEGARRGVPDILCDVPMDGKPGLRIEMKTPKGRLSPEQREWLDYYRQAGYRAEVCRSWIEARDTIMDYLHIF